MYNVLIVDDEPLTREFLRENIPELDGRWQVVAEAMDGREALDALDRHTVHLIVTDIKMPVMDGLELCRAVSERDKRPRIVILSGYDDFAMAKEAIRYGVNDYLLKPIVKEELRAALDKTASALAREDSESLAVAALRNASEASREQVAKQFLQAVVSDSSVEIKALYPLVFRLKIGLLEELGAVMLLVLDEESALAKPVPPRDIAIYRLLLHQVATEIAEQDDGMIAFFDRSQRTAVLVNGDSEAGIADACRSLYDRVSAAMRTHAGLTVTGAVGTPEPDVLQLNVSYRHAAELLLLRVVRGGGALYFHNGPDSTLTGPAGVRHQAEETERAVTAIRTALLEGGDADWRAALRPFAGLIGGDDPAALLRYGVYLIERLAELRSPPYPAETAERALVRLQQAAASLDPASREPAVESIDSAVEPPLVHIVRLFAQEMRPEAEGLDNGRGGDNERDIVSRAKAFIAAHYAEPLSLALVAERIGVSAAYLSSLFHKAGSESYIKYLTRIRMEQAARLLRANPAEKIYDVAEKVGYVSVKHFSYVFKQHFKMTPGEYQESSRGRLN